ncbi:MAG TPA: hypothetical protein PKE31_14555 [Pseudomonadota bacterium]|nr:hypothetical protein [Pseudomonadota bacterium]
MSEQDGGQQEDLGNLPGVGSAFGYDPGAELKKKGLPWPAYLAIGIALAAAFGFFMFRSYKKREERKVHVAFGEQFQEYEKNVVNAFWRCLFGKEGDGRRFNQPEQLNGQLEAALYADPKTFPEKVSNECVKKALDASRKVRDFSPPAPTPYEQTLDDYGKALAALANTLNTWAEGAGKRVETKLRENKIVQAGDSWSTTDNPNKADPAAWQYDKFLHCAVPNIDKMKDGQELLEFLASQCTENKAKGWKSNPEFLAKLRDTCIPEAQEIPTKTPATFKATFNKMGQDYDRLSQAWGTCLRKMTKESKKDDLDQFDKAWVESVNASTKVRKTIKEHLQDE